MDCANADLIRLGENALFRLSSTPVVVRVARTMEYMADAQKEVQVATWLRSINFPAARLHDVEGQPLEVDGHPVTFWRYFEGVEGNADHVGDLGKILRRLHSSAPPAGITLPTDNVLGRVAGRIAAAPVPQQDKRFLLDRCAELSDGIEQLAFPFHSTVIHGDAHVGNLMVGLSETILIDFERFGWGQPEWDLSVMATEYLTAGWWSADEYRRFVAAYGYDVTEWSGFSLLRATQEMKMTTWIMQNIGESPEIAREYEHRMQRLRTGEGGNWTPF